MRIPHSAVQNVIQAAHGVAALLLAAALLPSCTRVATSLLLLAPCVWLVPALYHVLFLHAGTTLVSNLCGGVYIVFLPAWLSYMTHDGDSESSEELPLGAFTTSAALCFYSQAQNHVAGVVCIAGAFVLLIPLAFHVQPSSVLTGMHVALTLLLAVVAVVRPRERGVSTVVSYIV